MSACHLRIPLYVPLQVAAARQRCTKVLAVPLRTAFPLQNPAQAPCNRLTTPPRRRITPPRRLNMALHQDSAAAEVKGRGITFLRSRHVQLQMKSECRLVGVINQSLPLINITKIILIIQQCFFKKCCPNSRSICYSQIFHRPPPRPKQPKILKHIKVS